MIHDDVIGRHVDFTEAILESLENSIIDQNQIETD